MKKGILAMLLLCMLTVSVQADELGELRRALPGSVERQIENSPLQTGTDFTAGISKILKIQKRSARKILYRRLRGCVLILMAVLLCGTVDGFSQSLDEKRRFWNLMPMAGAASVTLLSAGSVDSLMGLGVETMEQINTFSKVLLPSLAAAAAAGGAVGTAAVQQTTAVFFADLLMELISRLLLPMVYLYIGMLTAGAMLGQSRLNLLAEELRKIIVWVLSGALLLFTFYLTAVHIISGTADSTAVRAAKAAISGSIPVVGGILAEASETVLAGAGMLKNSIGVFGMLAVLMLCAGPFLEIGIQYLLYKLTALFAGIMGTEELSRLINGLGNAFGLILGMTGAGALLLFISILSFAAAVMP
jgi:stage III sporulation protein AE